MWSGFNLTPWRATAELINAATTTLRQATREELLQEFAELVKSGSVAQDEALLLQLVLCLSPEEQLTFAAATLRHRGFASPANLQTESEFRPKVESLVSNLLDVLSPLLLQARQLLRKLKSSLWTAKVVPAREVQGLHYSRAMVTTSSSTMTRP